MAAGPSKVGRNTCVLTLLTSGKAPPKKTKKCGHCELHMYIHSSTQPRTIRSWEHATRPSLTSVNCVFNSDVLKIGSLLCRERARPSLFREASCLENGSLIFDISYEFENDLCKKPNNEIVFWARARFTACAFKCNTSSWGEKVAWQGANFRGVYLKRRCLSLAMRLLFRDKVGFEAVRIRHKHRVTRKSNT